MAETSEEQERARLVRINASGSVYADTFPADCYQHMKEGIELAPGVREACSSKSTVTEDNCATQSVQRGGGKSEKKPAPKRSIQDVLRSNGSEKPAKTSKKACTPKQGPGKAAATAQKAVSAPPPAPLCFAGPVMNTRFGTMYYKKENGEVSPWPGHLFLHPVLRRIVFTHPDGHFQELDPETRHPTGRIWPFEGESEEDAKAAVAQENSAGSGC
jgi:hypothetical protein